MDEVKAEMHSNGVAVLPDSLALVMPGENAETGTNPAADGRSVALALNRSMALLMKKMSEPGGFNLLKHDEIAEMNLVLRKFAVRIGEGGLSSGEVSQEIGRDPKVKRELLRLERLCKEKKLPEVPGLFAVLLPGNCLAKLSEPWHSFVSNSPSASACLLK